MKESERGRNDWLIVFLFLFLGILLMLLAGQKGTQLLSTWNLRVDIGSNLDPNNYQVSLNSQGLPPLRSEIMTPPVWDDNYLTPRPGDQASATPPTFVVFDPSATPSVTATASVTTTVEPSLTTTATTTPPTTTTTATKTKKPTDEPPTPTATASPSPSPEPSVTSTIPAGFTEVSPTPAGLEVGPPDNSIATLPEGTYTVVNVSGLTVTDSSETNYDLIFYEYNTGSDTVWMDQIIIGISQYSDGSVYYEVFNWGDGDADTNSNLGDVTTATGTEYDNQVVSESEFYGPPPAPDGVLIDVDNAASNPPPGNYDYVVIISPIVNAQSPPAPSDDSTAQVDSIQVAEVPP